MYAHQQDHALDKNHNHVVDTEILSDMDDN